MNTFISYSLILMWMFGPTHSPTEIYIGSDDPFGNTDQTQNQGNNPPAQQHAYNGQNNTPNQGNNIYFQPPPPAPPPGFDQSQYEQVGSPLDQTAAAAAANSGPISAPSNTTGTGANSQYENTYAPFGEQAAAAGPGAQTRINTRSSTSEPIMGTLPSPNEMVNSFLANAVKDVKFLTNLSYLMHAQEGIQNLGLYDNPESRQMSMNALQIRRAKAIAGLEQSIPSSIINWDETPLTNNNISPTLRTLWHVINNQGSQSEIDGVTNLLLANLRMEAQRQSSENREEDRDRGKEKERR